MSGSTATGADGHTHERRDRHTDFNSNEYRNRGAGGHGHQRADGDTNARSMRR
jgi:hypothetical protein